MESAWTFADGVIVASELLYLAHQKARELKRIIDNDVGNIDDLLAEIIDTEGKQFTAD